MIFRSTAMQVKDSQFGVDTKEIYRNGKYLGLCSVESIDDLKALEGSVSYSSSFRHWLSSLMDRSGQRPLGGFTYEDNVKDWLNRYGGFGQHLRYEIGRGVLWSPVAWSLVWAVVKAKEGK